jgi:hypothetical protein
VPGHQRQTFMTPTDERLFCDLLRAKRPRLRVLDGHVWQGSEPAVCVDIPSCRTNQAGLWDPEAFPHVPTIVDSHGQVVGPQTGPVVQVLRSVYAAPDLLLAGRVASGWHDGDDAAAAFAKDVWAVLQRVCARRLFEVASKENASMYKAGDDAAHRSRVQALRLRARSSEIYFCAV